MKQLIIFLVLALCICSCTKNDLEREAREHLKSFSFNEEINSSSTKINGIETVFSNDSLCILRCTVTERNPQGDSKDYEIEYIYIRLTEVFASDTTIKENEAYVNLTNGEKSIFNEANELLEIVKYGNSGNSNSQISKLSKDDQKASMLYLAAISKIGNNNIKQTAIDYLKKTVQDPSSLKIENIEILFDTVPVYLNYELLSEAMSIKEKVDKLTYYIQLGDLWEDEASESYQIFTNSTKSFKSKYEKIQNEKDKSEEYIVLLKFSANNPYGVNALGKSIVIIDKKQKEKVLGFYYVDPDFVNKYLAMYMAVRDWKEKIKLNEYGLIDTVGLSHIEKFILSN